MRAGVPRQSREPYPPQPPRTPRPRFAISSRSTPLLSADVLSVIASRSSLTGIDIDLTGAKWRSKFIRPDYPETYESITSLWIPANADDCDTIAARIGSSQRAFIVIDEESSKEPNGKRQLATAIRLRSLIPSSTRVALAIRPRNPDGNRAHLGQIALLRHIAEEWDLDIAIDLCAHIDWLWEAEAVVHRLSSRLRLVRMIYPLPRLDAHTRTRITQRTIAACVDAAFDGQLSVVCPLPIWRWRDANALDRGFQTAVERLSDRFGLVSMPSRQDVPQRSSTS
jgi:hypothetical protein